MTDLVIYTVDNLAGLMARRGAWWAAAALPLIGVLNFSASSFCAGDPPDDPEISPAEYAALLALAPWDVLQDAIAKLADKAKIAIWYELCECVDTGGGSVFPTFPTTVIQPPTGVSAPQVQSGLCGSWTYRATARIESPPNSPDVTDADDIARRMLPSEAELVALDVGPGFIAMDTAVKFPAGWTAIQVEYEYVSLGNGVGNGVQVEGLIFGTDGDFYQGLDLHEVNAVGDHDRMEFVQPILAGTHNSFALYVRQNGGTVPGVVDVTLTADCGSNALGTLACRTDPAVLAILNQIYQLLQLVQRTAVPFAPIFGDVHAPLTGEGSFVVEGIIGVMVNPYIIPTTVGQQNGNPDVLWNVGWINFERGGMVSERFRIEHQNQFIKPPNPQMWTLVRYHFEPGVTATILEQLREPIG